MINDIIFTIGGTIIYEQTKIIRNVFQRNIYIRGQLLVTNAMEGLKEFKEEIKMSFIKTIRIFQEIQIKIRFR